METMRAVIENEVDVDAFDSKEWTPLCSEAYWGHLATVQALLAAGADVSLRFPQLKDPVKHVAAEKGKVEMVRAVIQNGADVNANQCTALYRAAWFNKAEAIDVLVAAGANIEAPNRFGLTPLYRAAYNLSHDGVLVNAQDGHL